jgi:hypothetical protein
MTENGITTTRGIETILLLVKDEGRWQSWRGPGDGKRGK